MHRRASAIDVFQAIADPTRRAILDLLSRGERGVSQLAEPFHMSLSAVSQHLKVLRDVGLVRDRRAGREKFYRLNAGPLREVSAWVFHYEQFWRGKLDALGEHLKRNP